MTWEDTSRQLCALQALLVEARRRAYEAGNRDLAELLDRAEYLPFLIAERNSVDFRDCMIGLAKSLPCPRLVEVLDDPALGSHWPLGEPS